MRRTYLTDLSDAEWICLEPHLPTPKATGRPRVYPLRDIINAIFYLLRSGCSWRLLPHDFVPWRSVYHCFRQFRLDGTWERLHAALRESGSGFVSTGPSAQLHWAAQAEALDDAQAGHDSSLEGVEGTHN